MLYNLYKCVCAMATRGGKLSANYAMGGRSRAHVMRRKGTISMRSRWTFRNTRRHFINDCPLPPPPTPAQEMGTVSLVLHSYVVAQTKSRRHVPSAMLTFGKLALNQHYKCMQRTIRNIELVQMVREQLYAEPRRSLFTITDGEAARKRLRGHY